MTRQDQALALAGGFVGFLAVGLPIGALAARRFMQVEWHGQPALTPAVRSTPAKRVSRPKQEAVPDRALERRRAELQERAEEVEAEYLEAEAERAEAESVLDANQHQVADLQTSIEPPTEELDHARQQLTHRG